METYSFAIYIKIDDIYIKILQNVLKQGFALQIVNWKCHYQKQRTKMLLA